METDKNLFRLNHILDSIEKIQFVTKNLSYEEFDKDWIPQDVVIRNLEIIGEASIHVSDNLKLQHPQVAWNEIRGMRNIIAHVYFDVNTQQIWDSIQDNLPELKTQIQRIIKDLEEKNI